MDQQHPCGRSLTARHPVEHDAIGAQAMAGPDGRWPPRPPHDAGVAGGGGDLSGWLLAARRNDGKVSVRNWWRTRFGVSKRREAGGAESLAPGTIALHPEVSHEDRSTKTRSLSQAPCGPPSELDHRHSGETENHAGTDTTATGAAAEGDEARRAVGDLGLLLGRSGALRACTGMPGASRLDEASEGSGAKAGASRRALVDPDAAPGRPRGRSTPETAGIPRS